jgi:hypothetical protein
MEPQFQEPNSYDIHVQAMSFIWAPVPKPVDIFLLGPSQATFTAHLIHLFTAQYKP